ncbi:ankyrin [Pandoraea anhela]|uniref:Ankyrin n=2 Tax=Pandoraea anhela TaxID=2508295 RepID=A0A5E4TFI3_9BURK|nr:ankyrin [Pandoraea anhela]
MSLTSAAGRELRDSCLIANPVDPKGLAFSMASLFCTPERRRTLADLDNAGIFIDRSRYAQLAAEDAALLMCDQGLQLWLRYAASPCAYPTLFVDAIMNGEFSPEPPPRLAHALRVLIACGRDTTNDVPISETPGDVHLPLSHLCSHVAVEWLPSLLRFGANPNQVTASGVPLIASAMAAQADRLHAQGCDLLILHESLYRLGKTLNAHGASLTAPSRSGSPPVMLLALNGYCGAAEVLLGLGATCNTSEGNRSGNTLMHQLASATQHKAYSFTAFFLFILALRYGGDPDLPNSSGVKAVSLLPDSLAQYVRLSQKMIAQARERALHVIANPRPKSAEETNGTLPVVSAALMAEAKRLCDAGQDPLRPHASLFHVATSLRQQGVDIDSLHQDGSPPVLWLALRGYCGAAEVLLALMPDCNAPRFEGNTLMHFLAVATRHPGDAIYADYMLNTALRYGGDPTIDNHAGHSAITSLTAERIRFLRAGLAFITQTRRRALQNLNNRRNPLARATLVATAQHREPHAAPLRHSAAAP